MSEYGFMKPLPIRIPYDLADVLETDPTNICHINAGRRHLPIPKCIRLMEIAGEDSRLTGLCFIHLRPELEPALPYLFLKKEEPSFNNE